jgi:hypothetical protein
MRCRKEALHNDRDTRPNCLRNTDKVPWARPEYMSERPVAPVAQANSTDLWLLDSSAPALCGNELRWAAPQRADLN